MRHLPSRIRGIAIETATDVVMNAAIGNPAQAVQSHVQGVAVARAGVVAQQEIKVDGLRVFRLSAKSSVGPVVLRAEAIVSFLENGFIGFRAVGREVSYVSAKRFGNAIGRFDDV